VAVSQIGRYFDGGASGTGFATYERATGPVVAYEPEHGVWLAQSHAVADAASDHAAARSVIRRR